MFVDVIAVLVVTVSVVDVIDVVTVLDCFVAVAVGVGTVVVLVNDFF
ncbi:MAG: hypothetical protein ACJAY5_001238 [Actinomycetes bacterium]